MLHFLILLGILICALQAVLSKRLLVTALWLAGTSALVSLMMYLLGAYQIAVIELSVGAGLVTILFVFAINIAGEEPLPIKAIIPKPIAWILTILMVGVIAWQLLPDPILANPIQGSVDSGFQFTLWYTRQLDLYLQIFIIFAGVLSMLGLLNEEKVKRVVPDKEPE
jgi:uncharacterized MnhB-related membrane protein